MRAIRLFAAALALAVTLISCELLFMVDVPDTSPQSIFSQAWGFADREYSFFALKEIDWDTIRWNYAQRVRSDMTDQQLFDLLAEMLYELRDGHVNLRSTFDYSRNWRWFLDYPSNYDSTLLERNYYNEEQRYVGPFVTVDLGDVVYARYGSFSNSFDDAHLDYLFSEYADRDGFILDVRDNGGGSSANAYRIAGRLVTEATAVGQERYKNGPAHDAFTEFSDVAIGPNAGNTTWSKPFVVLTNRSSYSATNLFVALVVNLDHVTTVGDTTGGGGGIPVFTELTNGWSMRVSGHQFYASVPFQSVPYNVELGIPADIDVDLDPGDVAAGVDTILETALSYIRGL